MSTLTTTDIIADIRRLAKHHKELCRLADSQEESDHHRLVLYLLNEMAAAYISGKTVTKEETP